MEQEVITRSHHNARWAFAAQSLLDIAFVFIPITYFAVLAHLVGLHTILSGVLINIGYLVSILVATRRLSLHNTTWSDIGLSRPRSWLLSALLSLAAIIGAIVIVNLVALLTIELSGMQLEVPDISRFNPLEGNIVFFASSLVLAWTSIAFGEEMFYRAFLINRLADVFQNPKLRWVLAAIGSSIFFGLAHYGEGPTGILSNGVLGLLFAMVYLLTGRNLWASIIAHGVLNSLRFVLIYFGQI